MASYHFHLTQVKRSRGQSVMEQQGDADLSAKKLGKSVQ